MGPGRCAREARSGGAGPHLPAIVPSEAAGDVGAWEAAQATWVSGDGEPDLLEQRVVPTPEVFGDGVPGLGLLREAVQEELRERGVLLDVGQVVVDGLPGVRVVSKQHDPAYTGGVAGVGVLVVPRQGVTVMLRVTCWAGIEAWQRRSIEVFTLSSPGECAGGWAAGWAASMLAVGDGVVACPADAPEWDSMFPRHPLSRVRRRLDALAASVRLSADFRSRPGLATAGTTSAGAETAGGQAEPSFLS